ncbi:DUF3310 domain-containing protein [Moraxella catarrhalis]|uniref:DUF3310 domain-containing protein n=1 Tax=Moraxella catarrhalis TaxID=480 RepID=UPI0007222B00|nr:DUF3310 domain-containing protein [Moraxella catarrhalis]AKI27829.1 hypothetical protein [Moraxella phage Mcat19]AKI27992.1 hypothetical protein [Moraxella phage Mcat23]
MKTATQISRDEQMMNELKQTENDAVNHPKHYISDPSGIECIQITRHRNFNIGNAIKYLWRAGLKDGNSDIQDLQKAVWYIQDEIERLEKLKGV